MLTDHIAVAHLLSHACMHALNGPAASKLVKKAFCTLELTVLMRDSLAIPFTEQAYKQLHAWALAYVMSTT